MTSLPDLLSQSIPEYKNLNIADVLSPAFAPQPLLLHL
jgi:hypothetical protein